MPNIETYRSTYKRWLLQYEKQSYKELRKTFKRWSEVIPFSMMSEDNYEVMLDAVINDDPMYRTFEKIYTDIGLVHGKRSGAQINKELKYFEFANFENIFLVNLKKYLEEFAADSIISIEATYKTAIKKLFVDAIRDGGDIRAITKRIQNIVKKPNFYKWQALRIARTESNTAANFSATQAYESNGFEMDKVWISARDSRVRRTPPDKYDHQNLNGKRVEPDKPFTTSRGEKLMFPGDRSGSAGTVVGAGNVINCRCSVGYRPRRDANGEPIRKGTPSNITSDTNLKTDLFEPAKTLKEAEDFAIKNGIKANYNDLTLKQANSINKAINNVKNKLKKDISLDIKEIKIVDSGDFHARADKDVLSINRKTWKDDVLKKHNSDLSETKQKRLKEIKRLKQQILDDPEEYYTNKKRVLEDIDFNEKWLKELNGKVEFSTVSTDVVSATEHELGHYINRYLSKNSKYTDEFVGNISRLNSGDRSQLMYRLTEISEKEGYKIGQYATRNASEYFAESWAAFMQGKNNIINKELLNIFKLISK